MEKRLKKLFFIPPKSPTSTSDVNTPNHIVSKTAVAVSQTTRFTLNLLNSQKIRHTEFQCII